MTEIKRILIIHPEGNINNNPNLHGIAEILTEHGFAVDIFSKLRKEFNQMSSINNSFQFLEDDNNPKQGIKIFFHKYFTPYICVIGIDTGIIEAAKIAKFQEIKLGYISYEIFFDDEIGTMNKIPEIEACKDLDFAVVQDKIRGELLANQNKIPEEKFIYIPVAGRNVKFRKRNKYLHNKLNIPEDKNIAIVSGSIAQWSIPNAVIDNLNKWPEEWVLVLHNRYGKTNLNNYYFEKAKNNPKLFLSFEDIKTISELNIILDSVSVGLAFYFPNDPWISSFTGKNVKYMGLSSGKISTYLSYGIPIITNITEPLTELNKKYNFGRIISNLDELPQLLDNVSDIPEENCHSFFNECLALDVRIKPFIDKINSCLIFGEAKYNFTSEELYELFVKETLINHHVDRLNNEIRNIYLSKTSRVGAFITKPMKILSEIFQKTFK